MKNPQELLLILSQEEREAAEDFLRRRLKFLGPDKVPDIEKLAGSARSSLEQVRETRNRLNPSSKAGKLMTRIYDSALTGYALLVKECNLTVSNLQKAEPSEAPDGDTKDGEVIAGSPLGNLEIEASPEDEQRALDIVSSTLEELDLATTKTLRDACESLLKWWQSDQGQQASLHVNQYGDLNTANGRMAIRKARDDLQQDVLVPFRSFFQDVNLAYQKKNQEHTLEQRKARLKEEAGLS